MRLLVFGGRDYDRRDIAFLALDHLHWRLGIEAVIHGAATGADETGGLWACARGIECFAVPADWGNISHADALIRIGKGGRKYDARAGARRNALMLAEYRPTRALEFPGGPGTFDMRRRCDAAGVPVFQVYEREHRPIYEAIWPLELWR